MKYLGIMIGMGAVMLALTGCAQKSSGAAQIHTPEEQSVMVDGEKKRMPLAASVL